MNETTNTPANENNALANLAAALTQESPTQAPEKTQDAPIAKVKAKGKAKDAKPAKDAGKPAKGKPATATQTPHAIPQAPIKFHLIQGYRPTGGAALFAHTVAFFALTGMLQGRSISIPMLRAIIGDTAYRHHGHYFEHTPQGITLNACGREYFGMRRNPGDRQYAPLSMVEAFATIMRAGKYDGDAVAFAHRNPAGIKPVA